MGGIPARAIAQGLQCHRVMAQRLQQRALRCRRFIFDSFLRLSGRGWHELQSLKLFEHIVSSFHQLGPLAYQRMAALGLRRVDGAGNGKDFTPLLVGQTGRDQRARLQGGFHDQGALRQAGDDAVALREMPGQGLAAQRVFADDQPMERNLLRQFGVRARIDLIESGADDGNCAGGRARAGLECSLMGGCIDAACQA